MDRAFRIPKPISFHLISCLPRISLASQSSKSNRHLVFSWNKKVQLITWSGNNTYFFRSSLCICTELNININYPFDWRALNPTTIGKCHKLCSLVCFLSPVNLLHENVSWILVILIWHADVFQLKTSRTHISWPQVLMKHGLKTVETLLTRHVHGKLQSQLIAYSNAAQWNFRATGSELVLCLWCKSFWKKFLRIKYSLSSQRNNQKTYYLSEAFTR